MTRKYSNQGLNLNSKEVVQRLFDLEARVDRLEERVDRLEEDIDDADVEEWGKQRGLFNEEVASPGSAPAPVLVPPSTPYPDGGAEVREPTFFTDDTAGAGGPAPADQLDLDPGPVDPVETSARLV